MRVFRQHDRTLRLAGWILYGLAGMIVGWALFWPVDVGPTWPEVAPARSANSARTVALKPTPGVDDFESLWQRSWQGDAAAGRDVAGPVAPGTQRLPLAIKLVGTVIESGNSLAMLSLPNGDIEFKRTGERLSSGPQQVEVVRIERQQVVLRYQGSLVTLAIHPDSPPS